MKHIRVGVLLLSLLVLITAQETSYTNCHNNEPVQTLDFNRLSEGVWYEVGRYSLNGYASHHPICPTTTFSKDGSSLTTKFISDKNDGAEWMELAGQLTHTGKENDGSYEVIFTNLEGLPAGKLHYNFLDIEYDDFAVIYGCKGEAGFFGVRRAVLWLLSRLPAASAKALERFQKLNIDPNNSIIMVNQSCSDPTAAPGVDATGSPITTEGLAIFTFPTGKDEEFTIPEITDGFTHAPTVPPFTGTYGPLETYPWPISDSATETETVSTTPSTQGSNDEKGSGFMHALLVAQWNLLFALMVMVLLASLTMLFVYRYVLPRLRQRTLSTQHLQMHLDDECEYSAPPPYKDIKSGNHSVA